MTSQPTEPLQNQLRRSLIAGAIATALLLAGVALSNDATAQNPIPELHVHPHNESIATGEGGSNVRVEVWATSAEGSFLSEVDDGEVESAIVWVDPGSRILYCWSSTNQAWQQVNANGEYTEGCVQTTSACENDPPNTACLDGPPRPTAMPPNSTHEPAQVNIHVWNFTTSVSGLLNNRIVASSTFIPLYNDTRPAFIDSHENVTIEGLTQFDGNVRVALLGLATVVAFANGWVLAGAGPWLALLGTQLIDPGDLTWTFGVAWFSLFLGLELVAHRFDLGRRIRRFVTPGQE